MCMFGAAVAVSFALSMMVASPRSSVATLLSSSARVVDALLDGESVPVVAVSDDSSSDNAMVAEFSCADFLGFETIGGAGWRRRKWA